MIMQLPLPSRRFTEKIGSGYTEAQVESKNSQYCASLGWSFRGREPNKVLDLLVKILGCGIHYQVDEKRSA